MARIVLQPDGKGRVVVVFAYDPRLVERIRAVAGRRWWPRERYWTVPDRPGIVEQSREAFRGEEIEVSDALWLAANALGDHSGDSWENHPLVAQVEQELTLRGYSRQTCRNYRIHTMQFLRWLGREPATAVEGDLRKYLQEMREARQLSASYCNQARATLQIIYERILRQAEKMENVPRMKEPKRLPAVLSREEVVRLVESASNLKHRALLMLAYSAGLRVSEVVSLRTGDIDAGRRQVRVRGGKGNKDRYTLLSDVALEALERYCWAYRPKAWLFPGRDPSKPLSVRSAQHIFERAKGVAGIQKEAGFRYGIPLPHISWRTG